MRLVRLALGDSLMMIAAVAAVAAYLALGFVGLSALNTLKWLAYAEADEAPPQYGWASAAHPVVVLMGIVGATALAVKAVKG